jgi:DnaJ-domain-containing protein 1
MIRFLAIVAGCFAVGYWLIFKLISTNAARTFHDGMADPAPPKSSAAAAAAVATPETASLSNWHIILGVDRNASKAEVKAAYKRQMGLHHPDKVSSLGEEIRAVANAKAKQINAAHDIAVRNGFA